MHTQEFPHLPRGDVHRRGFAVVLAFYLGWLGTLGWTCLTSPDTLTREATLSLTGISILFGSAFLLWYDGIITLYVRHLHVWLAARQTHSGSIAPGVVRRLLRQMWLCAPARVIRRAIAATLFLGAAAVPVLWVVSTML